MRSCAVALIWLALLCGCPGDPVEGSAGGEAGSTSTGASVTETIGSQSASDSTGGASMSNTSTEDTVTDPTTDPTSATLEDTSAQTDESATVADSTTDASAGETMTTLEGTTDTGECVEPDEPNQDEASAMNQGMIACNAADVDVVAVAHGATTPDWFRYFGGFVDDATCGTLNGAPRAELLDAPGLEVCLFGACPANATEVTCLGGATPTNSPVGGLSGCCATDVVAAALNCDNNPDESADVFVRVGTAGVECLDYTLRLTY